MAKAVHKITLSTSRDIPFDKLILSQSNVRRIKAGVSVEELAEDIARRGLLQGLNVRPVVDADGIDTGMYEIPAGGRRYQALALLVKQKRLAKAAPVPCVVRDPSTDILAEDDSLAENVQRVALHPLDQFRAFLALRERGQSEDDIATAFFVSVNVVKQRLRLASVSPALLEVYAEDGMSLEQLMAFTVSCDHARQQQVWEAVQNSWSKEPYHIRRMLTEQAVQASDKRVLFVGIEAYEAAGGSVMRDLFHADDGGWIEDIALLDRLVTDRLTVMADEIANEGWKWIEAAVNLPYDAGYGMRRLTGTPSELSTEEQASFEALQTEYQKLEADHEGADELPAEIDERLGEIETALEAFEDRSVAYDPAEISRAGAFVTISRDGKLSVSRGFVRPEDEPSEDGELDGGSGVDGEASNGTGTSPDSDHRAVVTIGGQAADAEEEDDDAIKPLPDRLVGELTAHRTLALQDAVGGNPHVALTVLLHKLCLDTFRTLSGTGCLEASVRRVYLPVQSADLNETAPAKSVAERHEGWNADLPADDQELWDWIDGLDEASRLALLGHCVSFGVNAVYEKADRYGGAVTAHGISQRLAQADRLARAVGLDMVEAGWRPTVETYLGRVTKSRILEAVREGKGEQAAQLIDHLKKADMAKEAERLLADTGWLPEPLRIADIDDVTPEPDAQVDALPAFLACDGEDAGAEAADDEIGMIAAE